jgi:alpha-L-fucosidase
MSEGDRALWERLRASYTSAPEVRAWFARWNAHVVAVRPDGVVLTAAGSGDVARLATAYRRWVG